MINIFRYICGALPKFLPFVQIKKYENKQGRVLFLVKLQVLAFNFNKDNTPLWMFSTFLNCTNATKSRKASHNLFDRMDNWSNVTTSWWDYLDHNRTQYLVALKQWSFQVFNFVSQPFVKFKFDYTILSQCTLSLHSENIRVTVFTLRFSQFSPTIDSNLAIFRLYWKSHFVCQHLFCKINC